MATEIWSLEREDKFRQDLLDRLSEQRTARFDNTELLRMAAEQRRAILDSSGIFAKGGPEVQEEALTGLADLLKRAGVADPTAALGAMTPHLNAARPR